MTDKELIHLRAYCASLMTRYGFDISTDNPATPMLYIIHREMEENNKTNRDIAGRIKSVSENTKVKNYHFNAPGEALKFQLGNAIKWSILGGLLVGAAFSVIWYVSIQSDVAKAKYILEHEPAVSRLLQQGKTNSEGYFFIDFKKSPDQTIQFFTEYEQIDGQTIRVYIDSTN